MSETPTPLEAETTGHTVAFDHFGRSWTVPAQRHLTHIKKMRDDLRAGYSDYNVLICEVMLGEEQFLELLEIDPDEKRLDEFVTALAKAMGTGNQGNS